MAQFRLRDGAAIPAGRLDNTQRVQACERILRGPFTTKGIIAHIFLSFSSLFSSESSDSPSMAAAIKIVDCTPAVLPVRVERISPMVAYSSEDSSSTRSRSPHSLRHVTPHHLMIAGNLRHPGCAMVTFLIQLALGFALKHEETLRQYCRVGRCPPCLICSRRST